MRVFEVSDSNETARVMIEMSEKLTKPPIIEAVLDIDCDLPPSLDFKALRELAYKSFSENYPVIETRFMFEHEIEHEVDAKGEAPPRATVRHGVDGYLFKNGQESQIVQVRTRGYSFNRLTPYSSLDDYMPEVKRTWEVFVSLVEPVRINAIRLRYINRICIPFSVDTINLDEFLRAVPQLPDTESLTLAGFLIQYLATESGTRNQVKTILTAQEPQDRMLPIIFDITATNGELRQRDDWNQIVETIQSLRKLKNRVFYRTLTEKCLQLLR